EEPVTLRDAKLGTDHPDTVLTMNNLAWTLALCPEPNLRNPRRAVELSKRAVERAAKNGDYWSTLGAAHYRAGEWKSALKALEKAIDLRNGGDSNDRFFLAMANWPLGNKTEARKWYDQAVHGSEKLITQD